MGTSQPRMRTPPTQSSGIIKKLSAEYLADLVKSQDGTEHQVIGPHIATIADRGNVLLAMLEDIHNGDLDPGDAKVRHGMAMGLTDVFVATLRIAALINIDLELSYGIRRAEHARSDNGKQAIRRSA